MNATTASFYVSGGTLRQDVPCFIERASDEALYEGLLEGEFCYALALEHALGRAEFCLPLRPLHGRPDDRLFRECRCRPVAAIALTRAEFPRPLSWFHLLESCRVVVVEDSCISDPPPSPASRHSSLAAISQRPGE